MVDRFDGLRGPGGASRLGAGQLVKVPVEVVILHQDLQELVEATRDLVQVAKEVNNALVSLVLARKEEVDGIGGTA